MRFKEEAKTWPTYWVTYYDADNNIVAQYTNCSYHQLHVLLKTTYRAEYGEE